jgi:hypothetical protein
MVPLLARLRALADERRVYALTSHCQLCLLAEDSYVAPWLVVIEPHGTPIHSEVDYLMPEGRGPWPQARVRGSAQSEDEAVQMILTAMEASAGWAHRE